MRRSVVARRALWGAVRRPTRRWLHQPTVRSVLGDVRARLGAAGITGSDAKALVARALEPPLASSNELFLWMDRELREEEAQRLERMVARREDGEPLAYVVGTKEFWSLTFNVTKDTLIPRADSECLIESLANLYPKTAPLRILDLGTGSGALLLSALHEYPKASGVGIDISKGALAVARGNASQLGLDGRSEFIELDMELLPAIGTTPDHTVTPTASSARRFLHQFDVILCNPPYIPLSELPLIAPDVLAHEPHGALFSAGPDAWKNRDLTATIERDEGDELGLRFYVALRNSVDKLLDPTSTFDSAVLMEIGSERQAHAVRDLFTVVASVSFDKFLVDAGNRCRGVVLRSKSRS